MTESFRQTPEQREAWGKQRRRAGIVRSMAARDGHSYASNAARKHLAEGSAGAISGPFDEAVRKLRQQGYPVYNAAVIGGKRDVWIVGRHTMTKAELLTFAGARP